MGERLSGLLQDLRQTLSGASGMADSNQQLAGTFLLRADDITRQIQQAAGQLADVDQHGQSIQHAAGHLRPDCRLLDSLDHRLRRKGQIDGMRLDGDDRQGLGNCTGRQRQAQYESGENIHVHKYKHTLIY